MKLRQLIMRIAGVDPGIMDQCPPKIRRKYFRAGLIMAFIFLACMVSGGFAFYLITDYILPSIPFGIIWATIIINLYRLTLVTVGNRFILPSSKVKFPLFSILVRMVFLGMLAFFISKPLEIMFHNGGINPYLEQHKATTLLSAHEAGHPVWNHGEVQKLMGNGPSYYEKRVRSSGYMIQRLRILHAEFPGTWWFTALFIFIYLMPFLGRIWIAKKNSYDEVRANIERELIYAEYADFKARYAELLAPYARKNEAIVWYEPYADAPFNTEPMEDQRKFNLKGSLKNWIIDV